MQMSNARWQMHQHFVWNNMVKYLSRQDNTHWSLFVAFKSCSCSISRAPIDYKVASIKREAGVLGAWFKVCWKIYWVFILTKQLILKSHMGQFRQDDANSEGSSDLWVRTLEVIWVQCLILLNSGRLWAIFLEQPTS